MRTPVALPLVGALGALALAGCTPKPIYQEETAVHQQLTLVTQADTAVVEPARGARALGAAEFERIRRFVLETGNAYGTHVTITPGPATSDATLGRIAATLIGAGVSKRNVAIAATTAPTGAGVTIRREIAVVALPDCPPLNRDSVLARENDILGAGKPDLPPPRLGCATAANLGLMLADPRELVEPNRSGGAPGYRGETTVDNYRSDKIPALGGTTETLGSPAGGP